MTERFADDIRAKLNQPDSESQRKYDMGEVCCYCCEDIAKPEGMPTVCEGCQNG